MFEHELHRFNTNDYRWETNNNGNLQGYELSSNRHVFTWQPHGSQFTIIYDIGNSASLFKVRRPPILNFNEALKQVGFSDDWVTFVYREGKKLTS